MSESVAVRIWQGHKHGAANRGDSGHSWAISIRNMGGGRQRTVEIRSGGGSVLRCSTSSSSFVVIAAWPLARVADEDGDHHVAGGSVPPVVGAPGGRGHVEALEAVGVGDHIGHTGLAAGFTL